MNDCAWDDPLNFCAVGFAGGELVCYHCQKADLCGGLAALCVIVEAAAGDLVASAGVMSLPTRPS